MAISWCDGDGDPGTWGSAIRVARDQFVYFITLACQDGEPSDWPSFRLELVAALNAAWGLDTRWGHRTAVQNDWTTDQRHRRALAVLDELYARIDPADDWPAFFEALWETRATIRADVVPPMLPVDVPLRPARMAVRGCCTGRRQRSRLGRRPRRRGACDRCRGPRR